MTNSTSSRDRSRIAVAAVSGITTVVALSATGWVAGTAAHTANATTPPTTTSPTTAQGVHHQTRTAKHPRVVLRQRPQRTSSTVRYVRGAPSAPVGSGGTVSQPVTHAPAAPAPAPAPSSGS